MVFYQDLAIVSIVFFALTIFVFLLLPKTGDNSARRDTDEL